ncbi:hypothetical protein BDR04DRAFT_1102254, partial [Suillus decipiens]
MLIFGDDPAKNKHMVDRHWMRPFVRGTRWSILPIVTHDIVHGSVTSKRFVEFFF